MRPGAEAMAGAPAGASALDAGRVLLVGYYGFGNLGDELLLAAVAAGIRELFPGAELRALSGDPEESRRRHGIEAVRWNDPAAVVAAVRWADLVVLGGGGLFHDYWGVEPEKILSAGHSGVAYYAGVAGLARLLGRPVVAWGVGLGPLTTLDGRRLTADLFAEVTAATVRDEGSRALLDELGAGEAEVVPDPTFSLSLPPRARRPGGAPPRIGVALRPWDVGADPHAVEGAVADTLAHLSETRGAEVVLLPFQAHPGALEGDLVVAERLQRRLGHGVIVAATDASPSAPADAIAGLDALIGMRLHALILAIRHGVPVIGLAYDPKVERLLTDAGQRGRCFVLPGLAGDRLAVALGEVLDGREEIGEELRRFAAVQERLARETPGRIGRQLASQRSREAPALRRAVAAGLARLAAGEAEETPGAPPVASATATVEEIEGRLARAQDDIAHLQREREALEHALRERAAVGDPVPDRPFGRYDLVVFSIVPWSFRRQRPQHLASRFADKGHRVFVVAMDRVVPRSSSPAISELGPNLWEVVLPSSEELRIHSAEIGVAAEGAMLAGLEELRDRFGIARAVSLVQVATWAPVALEARERFGWRLVYDCMDEWDTFPKIGRAVVSWERRLVARADLVATTAERLRRKWEGAAQRLLLLRNGTEYERFASATPLPEVAALPAPRVGYFGALAEWVDLELLAETARARPGYSFILAGGAFDVDLSVLAALPNVTLLGQRPYEEMPSLLAALDVCLIPFRENEVTAATDPVKFYEYLSQGKPVVATPLPELAPFSALFYPATGAGEFLRQLDRAVAERDPELARRRQEFALANDWQRRQEALDAAICSLLADLATDLRGDRESRHTFLEAECGRLRGRLGALMGEVERARRGAERERRQLLSELAEERRRLGAEVARGQERAAAAEAAAEALRGARERGDREVALAQRDLEGSRGELSRALEELARARDEGEGRQRTIEGLKRELAQAVGDREDVFQRGERYRLELMRVYHSRLWKIGSLYWSWMRRLGLLDARGARPGRPGPGAGAGGTPPADLSAIRERESEAEQAQTADPFPVASEARHDVICLPIIDWDFRFQRPQQLMSRFGAAGHRVFYLSQRFRPAGVAFEARVKAENVYEVSLRSPALNVYRDAPGETDVEALFAALDELRRDAGIGGAALVVQLPFWWPLAARARERFGWPVIYDCMDHHAGFSTNDARMLQLERELLAGADRVVVSSTGLEAEARRHSDRVTVVRNGCDFDHFASVPERAAASPPVVGYYGAISDWFDVELVEELARRRPEWRFVLVGSTFGADVTRLARLDNVELPGEVPYADLPGWLDRFDACVIPFRRTPLTEATNPVKAYEILAAGKPLVSTPLPEVLALGDLVRTASDADGFGRELAAALAGDDGEARHRGREFARGQTWEHRLAELAPVVEAAFPRASVVVVTYNNREWNRTCVESVLGRTGWPNLQLIAIDNGSVDGTPELLAALAHADPRLEIVLNEENRGFATASNQGLALASGEYLVLLNNDTAVSRGWLAALIRHLRSDPRLGLVGASTNEIGNEGKVEVGYEELAEMPVWARRFVRAQDGRREPVRMLAMFCVAMRREVFDRIGPLDEQFEIGMFEDDDYSRRVHEEGYGIAVARDAFVHHAGRASFQLLGDARYLEVFARNRALFERKWGPWQPHLRPGTGPALRAELARRVRSSGATDDRVVVFLPSIGWNIALVQRPHHLAREMARRGWFVVFDVTGSMADYLAGFVEVEPNLLLFCGDTEGLTGLENPVVWAFPYNAALAGHWPRPRIVYDLIDDLDVFPYSKRLLRRNHERMLRDAELVACVSKPLVESVRESRPDALYLPNAVEFDRFAAGRAANPLAPEFLEFVASGRPLAGYYGAIASWFDLEMLAGAARARPDWGFVVIGVKLADAPSLAPLERLENVLVLPPQRYEDLPGYLAAFTVALIPFKVNAITKATSPLKLYEYFAAGKPVISAPMPECEAFPEVRIATGGEQLAELLDLARSDGGVAERVARWRSLGSAHSWSARVGEVETRLSGARREGEGGR